MARQYPGGAIWEDDCRRHRGQNANHRCVPSPIVVSLLSLCAHGHHSIRVPTSPCPHVTDGKVSSHPTVTTMHGCHFVPMSLIYGCHPILRSLQCMDVTLSPTWGHHPTVAMMQGCHPILQSLLLMDVTLSLMHGCHSILLSRS